MSSISIIAKRDFLALFRSSLFWSLAGFCSLVWSASFIRIVYAFIEQQASSGGNNLHMTVILTHVSWVNVILLFCAPIITMRLIAEEKGTHTFDLLLTSPLTSMQITLGKAFAGILSVGVLVLLSLLYPLGITFMANVDFSTLLSAYLGLMLMASVYVSVGVFCSSLTSSVLLSAVMALIINLSIFITNGVGQTLQNTSLGSVLAHMELTSHFWQFLKGVIPTESLVFILTVIVFFIFLTQRVIESARWR